MKKIVIGILCIFASISAADAQAVDKGTSTRSAVVALMRDAKPSLELDTTMSAEQFAEWKKQMSAEMTRLMRHPDAPVAPAVKVAEAQRDGYRIEKWNSFPLPETVVPYYVLIPDGVDKRNPAPGVLCIPGFGQIKELVAGERAGNYTLEGEPDSVLRKAAMAVHFAKEGLVAVAVDNPSFGELNDNGVNDYLVTSRFLLELGWSYLGLASWQDKVILDWMKTQPEINKDRLIVCGFSLGTEPLMALGLMDDSIYAFVYNDFLCRTRERALVMDKPDANGRRGFPNGDEHLIPEFLTVFDFPDIVAALAPRPVICTEGGMDRDFKIISKAYDMAEAPDAFEYHHYAKYADPANRQYLDTLPAGLDRAEFFRLANVDSPNHYFKLEWIIPWVRNLLSNSAPEK